MGGKDRQNRLTRLLAHVWSLHATVALLAAAALYGAGASVWDWGFRSPWFLGIAGLFTVNLGACTIRRLIFRRHRGMTDYLPDLAHVGLLILLVAGAGSLVGRGEEALTLRTGDEFVLENRYELYLEETVNTGRNWESTFRITDRNDRTAEVARKTTRVNRPFTIGRTTLYQTGWGIEPVIHLAAPGGETLRVSGGEGFAIQDRAYLVQNTADGVVVTLFHGDARMARRVIREGDQIEMLRVTAIYREAHTIVTAVQDPGVVPAAVGGLILTVSMAWFAAARAFGSTTRKEDPAP